MSDNWLDKLSEILSQPLPGTAKPGDKTPAPDKPVILPEDESDDSLLDRITDILTKPLPGTEQAPESTPSQTPASNPDNPGEVAVQEAQKQAGDPVSGAAAGGANWMQVEYQRFMAYQEQTRKAFADRQKLEQERFAAYQRAQMERMMQSQERERMVFQQHQQARAREWQNQLNRNFAPPGGPPPGFPPGMMPPPPPPPWWRGRR